MKKGLLALVLFLFIIVVVGCADNKKTKLKFEVFPDKKSSEVSGFTENAKVYEG